MKAFLKADSNTAWKIHERIVGSPDIFDGGHRPTGQSINYITSHDGFTLNDLVSYNSKHNDQNRNQNRDETDANLSWNCGAEGPTTDSAVEGLRIQQIKNFFTLTLLSVGTPMLLMGDEIRRTQLGNNNAYCLGSKVSWFDWGLHKTNAEIVRFVQELIRLRLHFDRDPSGNAVPLEATFAMRTSSGMELRWTDPIGAATHTRSPSHFTTMRRTTCAISRSNPTGNAGV